MTETQAITRQSLLPYFLQAAKPREQWLVGLELEQLVRDADSGCPIPYAGPACATTSATPRHSTRRTTCGWHCRGKHFRGTASCGSTSTA